ncbi:MAG TPA: NUDIX domain-containing protein [Lentimicrobium sp.]|nr:NUDIX domain-containing protein [Lentimicrobium sp.]
MVKHSAGILVYRFQNKQLQILLVHPGGPYWAHKDDGVWSIPKGEIDIGEKTEEAAKREFYEETGFKIDGDFIPLSPVRLMSGKIIHAFAIEGDLDASLIHSNNFSIEWPPSSGKIQQFPEIDKGEWFTPTEAKVKLSRAQVAFINELMSILNSSL